MINQISPQIESAGGVAAVNVSGGQDRAIMVDVDPAKLQAHGLTLSTLSQRLSEENISLPAGNAVQGETQYNLRSSGYFRSIDEIRDLPIGQFEGSLVKLGQVANVRDASQDVVSYIRMDGEPALSLTVTKQSDANTVEAADSIKKAITDIEARNPDLTFNAVYDQSKFISRSIHDLQETAVIGGILAILIITFFLRNIRSTFVVALSIPVSIISTFALLYFCGFTLNTISLSGLALAVGLIVDDAIVVLENIYRHIERDKAPIKEAAVTGTQEILSAVFASTFTVMIVFLPLLLIQGQAGQVFTQFALVVIFSLAVSLLDATTIVPMLSSRWIRRKDVHTESVPQIRDMNVQNRSIGRKMFDRSGVWLKNLDNSYRTGLKWSLNARWLVLGIGVTTVVTAYFIWPMVGQEQLPETDSGNVTLRVKLPVGSRVEATDAAMKQIEQIVLADPDVETVMAGAGANVSIRGAGVSAPQEGSATLLLKADRQSETSAVIDRLKKALAVVPGTQVQVQPLDMVSRILGGSSGFSVDVYGQNLDDLATTAERVRDAISDIPGLDNVDLDVQDAIPEIRWSVDRDKAQTLGVSFEDVARVISVSTGGQLATYYQEDGFQYPIYVQVPRTQRLSIEDIAALPVSDGANGVPITLGQVATPEYAEGPNEIQRQNRQRFISVGGNLLDRSESEVQADVQRALADVEFPEGTYWAESQQQQRRAEEFAGLGLAAFLAIALIYMLLAAQFESFVDPLVILVSVPLCAIGLVLALFLSGRAFGLTAFIGVLMLIGIVVKNGILLVDYTNQLRKEGMDRDEAILLAGPTRLRPILMTALAAMLGMMPLAVGVGSGSELYAPLATAVIGGLATSTIMTLFMVPIVYTIFDDFGGRMAKRKTNEGSSYQSDEPPAPPTSAAGGAR